LFLRLGNVAQSSLKFTAPLPQLSAKLEFHAHTTMPSSHPNS
jgi:hypothetical protein